MYYVTDNCQYISNYHILLNIFINTILLIEVLLSSIINHISKTNGWHDGMRGWLNIKYDVYIFVILYHDRIHSYLACLNIYSIDNDNIILDFNECVIEILINMLSND